jgi:cobalamin biosynthesis protein CbiG
MYMTELNGGRSQYDYEFSKALKDGTYKNLNEDTKQYIADCQESNRIAKKKGINLRKTVDKDVMDKQIREICDEVSIRKPDARTEDEKNIVFDRGQEE